MYQIANGRSGGDQAQAELPLQSLLDDLHVEEAEESAAEPESQGGRRLRLEGQGSVVQPQLLQRLLQVLVTIGVGREEPREYHRLGGAVARQRSLRALLGIGDGVTYAGIADVLDGSGEVTDLAHGQLLDRAWSGLEAANLVDLVDPTGSHQTDASAGSNAAIHHPHVGDHAPIGVIDGVEDQSP